MAGEAFHSAVGAERAKERVLADAAGRAGRTGRRAGRALLPDQMPQHRPQGAVALQLAVGPHRVAGLPLAERSLAPRAGDRLSLGDRVNRERDEACRAAHDLLGLVAQELLDLFRREEALDHEDFAQRTLLTGLALKAEAFVHLLARHQPLAHREPSEEGVLLAGLADRVLAEHAPALHLEHFRVLVLGEKAFVDEVAAQREAPVRRRLDRHAFFDLGVRAEVELDGDLSKEEVVIGWHDAMTPDRPGNGSTPVVLVPHLKRSNYNIGCITLEEKNEDPGRLSVACRNFRHAGAGLDGDGGA